MRAQSGVLEAATSLIGSLPVGLPNTPEDRARLRDALTPPIGTLEGLASLHGEMVVLLARADDIEKAYNGREDAREQLQAAKAEHEKHKGSYQQKKDLMKSAKTAAKGAERQKEKGTLGFDLEHTMHVAKAYTCSGKKEVLEAETGVDKANARFEELTSALVADVAEFEARARGPSHSRRERAARSTGLSAVAPPHPSANPSARTRHRRRPRSVTPRSGSSRTNSSCTRPACRTSRWRIYTTSDKVGFFS